MPVHILAPAIHKQMDEVKQLFDAHVGHDPGSADPQHLVERARVAMRPYFVHADLGITGANFAVAESGTLILVTNEGNGRLVTSGPPVQIALVPIEKIVPTLEQAATLVQLLVRTAGTPGLTGYLSWMTGPRRLGELDGPRELHIVLVDNGRSDVIGTELEEALYCIRCSACLNVCPVYRRVGGHAYESVYSGPIGIPLTTIVPGAGHPSDDRVHASSLCGRCSEVCPVGIDIPHLILESRHRESAARPVPSFARLMLVLYAFVVTRPWCYRLALYLGQLMTRLIGRAGWIDGGMGAWTQTRSFRGFSKKSFRQRFIREADLGEKV
jgi:L-lactate dehydrogenase complex protein LldF